MDTARVQVIELQVQYYIDLDKLLKPPVDASVTDRAVY